MFSPALRRLMGYYRPHLPALLLSVLLMALAAGFPAAIVFLIRDVLDQVLIARDEQALRFLPWAVVGLYVGNGIVHVWRSWLTRSVALQVVTQLRQELFEHSLRLGPLWHQKVPLGAQLTRLNQDVGHVVYLVSAFATVVQKPLTLVGLLVAAWMQDWRLTLVSIFLLPLVVIPIDRFGRRLRRKAREGLDNLASLTSSAQETLSGIRIVQAFGAEPQRAGQFEGENQRQYRLTLQVFMAQLLPSPVVEAIAAVGVGLAIAYGGERVFANELQPGELIAFLVAMGLMNQPLKASSEINALTQRALAGAQAAFDVLDTPPLVESGEETLAVQSCTLRLEAVGFDYGDGPVLREVSLEARPGELIALVGHSGSGKSTLLSLIPRFQDPGEGQILLNGKDLRDFTLRSLRRHVAVVTQDTFLFHSSVLENVRLGRPEATEEQVIEACRAANAHDFIAELPEGYHTSLGETGSRLSGGQRQRLCIARALLLDAPILLLDEATSALDRESEVAVQEALQRLMRDRTTLAIAHRLSTIRHADCIVVLDQGEVVERGQHEELLALGGEYARLHGEGEGRG